MTQNFSLFDSLDNYGFVSKKQKEALQHLMQEAKILNKNQSIQDKFPAKSTYHELVIDILEFVHLTQKYFTIRNGHQERWDVKPHEWMKQHTKANLESLKTLGVISAIHPQIHSPDAICILGATMPSMIERFNYADSIVKKETQLNNLILLSGERYITLGIDASEEVLSKIAIDNNLDNIAKLTETHLIETIYKSSNFYNKAPTYIIDTPAENLPRPTTQTTIIKLIEWLKNHEEIKSITFISNQPYVLYQEAIITETLRSLEFNLNFEVVGNDYQSNNLQSAIESLGSYIFAHTPDLLIESKEKISDFQIIDSLKNLYAKQPLIYHNLEHIFINNCTTELTGLPCENSL